MSTSDQRHFLVRLTPDAVEQIHSPQQAQSLFANSGAGLHVVRGLGLPGQLLVATGEHDSARIVTALQNNRSVAHFEEDYFVGATDQRFPNEQTQSPFFADQYGLNNMGQNGGTADADIDAPEAWSLTTGSSQVIVSVIDSGVDVTHPDLYRNIWLNNAEIPGPLRAQLTDTDSDGQITFRDLNAANGLVGGPNTARVQDLNHNGYIDAADLLNDPLWSDGIDTDNNGFEDDLVGWDFQQNDNKPFDEHGHGTHVAGILGASGDNGIGVVGVNWTTSILPLRFLDENNTGDLSDAIEAINYQTLLRTRETSPANIRVSNNSWGVSGALSQNLFDAVSATGAADILFVAAAGNGDALGRGIDNDQTPFFPANLDLPNVISVGAFGPDGSLARFSNFGDQTVDIAAPGVGIVSTSLGGTYISRNGTSMAAPFVTGTAVLVFSSRPAATAHEVLDALESGAATSASFSGKIAGARMLNAFGALTAPTFAPVPHLAPITDITVASGTQIELSVNYTDDEGILLSSLDVGDVEITRPGFSVTRLVPTSVDRTGSGTTITAIYHVSALGGVWDATDNGEYVVALRADQVADVNGIRASRRELGRFQVAINDPSVFFVNTVVDSVDANLNDGVAQDALGRTSLRAAIMQSNATAGLNTIVLPDGVYSLALPGQNEEAAAAGDLDVTDSLNLIGSGRRTAVIDANRLDRVVDVAAGVSLTVLGVTLQRGNSNTSGGAIRNAGSVTLTDVTLSDNIAVTEGGGLHNRLDAMAMLTRVVIDGNQTTDSFDVGGGGISNEGTLTIESSSLVRNRSVGGLLRFERGGAGGLFNAISGTVTLVNSTISTNTTTNGDGGGIYNAGTLHALHTTVTENRALSGDGGGIFNDDGPDSPVFRQAVAVMGPAGGEFHPTSPPTDLATDANGRVYVADRLNHRVQVFNADGSFLLTFGHNGFGDGEFNEPFRVVVTPNGEIFVADQTKRIQRFNASGQFQSAFTITSITPPCPIGRNRWA